MPNLIIQPLVENAVVHGMECKEGGGTVTVSGYATQKKLVILVEDNGVGMEQEKLDLLNEELANVNVKTLKIERTKHRGIALLNINQRIRLLWIGIRGIDYEYTQCEYDGGNRSSIAGNC